MNTIIDVLRMPKHGKLVLKNPDAEFGNFRKYYYTYISDKDYEGLDEFEFKVSVNGKELSIYYQVKVDGEGDSPKYENFCKRDTWKISQSGEPDALIGDLAAWQRYANLSALIASAQQTVAGFTDLPGTALGQTTGEGASAQITLDQNAAGHGWFVDPPLDNTDDYLPTSDLTVFKAKAGSAAEGKMDMLSVLLHEYGHALGLEHSATASDFMAASLQPGVRKLPSADELALMARLVAELKGDQTNSGQPDPTNPANPTNPFAPSPLSVLGLLPLGLMRRSGSASTTTNPTHTTHTDYLTAINPTLTNGNFAAGQSGTVERWETTGKVNIDSAAPSTITLDESTTAQAHLAQAFIITPQDRFLTFTVSGLALQTNSIQQNGILTAAPQDAFEVALTNANTGTNLLASLATDHSDALLNIQLASSDPASALQERSAAGLRHTDNPDGSRTYLLDLSAISSSMAANNNLSNTGVAVNLSFDLIGFGIAAAQLGSQVSIKDVRLIKSPVAVDDTATLAEDNSITINANANDFNTDVATGSSTSAADFTAKIVTTAQHGQVSLNPDGTFGYTPDANFYGTDSFSYQYSNALGEQSNTATVSLSVTPVNDAPVAADVAVTTLEDTLATINLVALDADNTSASLQFTIKTQPTNSTLIKYADGSYRYTPAANPPALTHIRSKWLRRSRAPHLRVRWVAIIKVAACAVFYWARSLGCRGNVG